MNLVGYVRADTGVGESVRLAALALDRAQVPRAVRGVAVSGPHTETNSSLGEDELHPYFFNLVHINADQFPGFFSGCGRDLRNRRTTIGYWAWELEEFPDEYAEAFQYCDEVWTPSRFCTNAISRRALVPVQTIPHPLRAIKPNGLVRGDFGIQSSGFVFLTMVDMLSVAERKNPVGAIRAFEKAFGDSTDAQLVVKISNGSSDRLALDRIRTASSSANVKVVDETMSRPQVDDLLNACDCYVSLHRAEGFGLCMAEAMSLQKPVIATAYSGNLDFMDESSAFLVSHRPISVGTGCGPYDQRATWADPDLDVAAKHMQVVSENDEHRHAIAVRGADHVRRVLSPDRIGSMAKDRLEILYRIKEDSDA